MVQTVNECDCYRPLTRTQIEAYLHGSFKEWKNSSECGALMALLTARLELSLRDASQTESVINHVLTFAEVAYNAGILRCAGDPQCR